MKLLYCHLSQEASMIYVAVQTDDFNSNDEEIKLEASSGHCGAIVTFKGVVRGYDQEPRLNYLHLEHFPGITEQEIERIIKQAQTRWQFTSCRVIHRVGDLAVGDPIVLVMVSARHRKEAFQAAEFIMDYLKTEAPFWKKEYFQDGRSNWVEAKSSDTLQKQRWDSK